MRLSFATAFSIDTREVLRTGKPVRLPEALLRRSHERRRGCLKTTPQNPVARNVRLLRHSLTRLRMREVGR